jgi:hypothetical protein
MQLAGAKQAKRRRLPSHPDETETKRGRPPNKAIQRIIQNAGKRGKKCSRATAYRRLKRSQERHLSQREQLIAETAKRQFCPIIKPSDVWNIDPVCYARIDPDETHGYIPGDLYCNCLFWFANGDLVVAPMAGSGMIHHVLRPEERVIWAKGRLQPLEVDLRIFDLAPRGPYKALIKQHNILDGFPTVERAPDYVIIDPPYLGACRWQYSRRRDDLANMDEAAWTDAMRRIALSCAQVGAKRCTIIVSALVNHAARQRVLCGEIVRAAWQGAGYRLFCVCYADKRIQQQPRMPRWNNVARETLLPMSGMAEVLTFDLLAT